MRHVRRVKYISQLLKETGLVPPLNHIIFDMILTATVSVPVTENTRYMIMHYSIGRLQQFKAFLSEKSKKLLNKTQWVALSY